MDWLNQYLNELDKSTQVIYFPPDKQSWNKSNPTKQQTALIQDAIIADLTRMRLIQEARRAEIDAGMGGGYDAGSAAKENQPLLIPLFYDFLTLSVTFQPPSTGSPVQSFLTSSPTLSVQDLFLSNLTCTVRASSTQVNLVSSMSFFDNSNFVTGINLNAFSNLQFFTYFGNINNVDLSNLTKLKGVNISRPFSLPINNPANSFEYIVLNTASTNITSQYIDTLYYLMSAGNSNVGFTSQFIVPRGRTSNSDGDFMRLFRGGTKLVNTETEIDAKLPVQTAPADYVPSTINSLTLFAPVTTNNTGTIIKFNALSGNYLKTSATYNNRDTFKNNNDYFVLYDNINEIWTVVGPLSTSNNVLLSSQAGVADWGNPPSVNWGGKAFSSGGNSNGWYRATNLFDTRMLLFSALDTYTDVYYTGMGIFPNLLSGYNNNFLWNNYDFSGIVYSDGLWTFQGRGCMLSPVHVLYSSHYPMGWANNTEANNNTVKIVNKDNTITTVTVISGLSIGADMSVGILNTPVNTTYYPVFSGSIGDFRQIFTDKSKFNNFLFGPSQTGRVGQYIPRNNLIAGFLAPNVQDKIYTIPNSKFQGEVIKVGDSSSPFWYTKNNQLVLLGTTFSAQPGALSQGFLTPGVFSNLMKAATALNAHYYGNPNIYLPVAT